MGGVTNSVNCCAGVSTTSYVTFCVCKGNDKKKTHDSLECKKTCIYATSVTCASVCALGFVLFWGGVFFFGGE